MECLLSDDRVLGEAVQLQAPAKVRQELCEVVSGLGVPLSVRDPGGEERRQQRLEGFICPQTVGQVVDDPGGREERLMGPLVGLPAGLAPHSPHQEEGDSEGQREKHAEIQTTDDRLQMLLLRTMLITLDPADLDNTQML